MSGRGMRPEVKKVATDIKESRGNSVVRMTQATEESAVGARHGRKKEGRIAASQTLLIYQNKKHADEIFFFIWYPEV